MNITKVSKTAAFVNYVKPGIEMLEMEVEGAILMFSTDNGSGGGDGEAAGGDPLGGSDLRSSKPRIRR